MRGLVALLVVLLAACAAPEPSQTASDQTYVLTVAASRSSYRVADAIDVHATLEYRGPQPSIVVTGPDQGLVWTSFKQLGGSIELGPGSRLMCSDPRILARGAPVTYRPLKEAGFAADDPNAAFYRSWLADPLVHLPAGTWQVLATAEIWDSGSCGIAAPSHELHAPVLLLRVTP